MLKRISKSLNYKSALALSLLILLILCLSTLAQAQDDELTPTVLLAARMLDVNSGQIIQDAVVVVKGNKIKAAGSDIPIPEDARIINLGDMILLPGLINCHTHLLENYSVGIGGGANMVMTVATMSPAKRALLGAKMGREALMAGITTVRDVGNSGFNGDVALRDAIEKGWVMGPRMHVSTRALAPVGGQFPSLAEYAEDLVKQEYAVVTGVADARQAVKEAVYDGADLIKVIVNAGSNVLSLKEMKAIVEAAHRLGKRVAAHATTARATWIAAKAGVTSIEHGYTLPDSVIKIMAKKNIFLVPTDYPVEFYLSLSGQLSEKERQKMRKRYKKQLVKPSRDRLIRAVKMGVSIAFGSDEYYDVPGYTRGEASLLVLQAYQNDGIDPLQIIRFATINAAKLLGVSDKLGSIEAGKLADIIAVKGHPLKDVSALQNVRFVMKGGEVVRNDLKE